jgi:Flp pilus assembly protein TadB
VFRRSKSEAPSSDPGTGVDDASAGKKGRPTPSRKEAEAAARARAKVPRTRKELAAAQRLQRSESSSKMRQAMKTGDEKYLPARDRGPVKKFIRDFVDSRFSFVELMIPVLLVTTVMAWSGNSTLASYGNAILFGMLLLIIVDTLRLRSRQRKEIARRFPEAPLKGMTYYAVMRSLQMKFMRLPKSQVRIGQRLPEHYR